MEIINGHNCTFAIGGVFPLRQGTADRLDVAESLLLRIKFSGKKPAHRQCANRYKQP